MEKGRNQRLLYAALLSSAYTLAFLSESVPSGGHFIG